MVPLVLPCPVTPLAPPRRRRASASPAPLLCPRDLTFTCDASDGGNCITTGVEALSRLSLGTTAAIMWRDVGILFGFIFGFHALAYLLVRFKASGSFIPLNPNKPSKKYKDLLGPKTKTEGDQKGSKKEVV